MPADNPSRARTVGITGFVVGHDFPFLALPPLFYRGNSPTIKICAKQKLGFNKNSTIMIPAFLLLSIHEKTIFVGRTDCWCPTPEG
jgi:hypothetical protein